MVDELKRLWSEAYEAYGRSEWLEGHAGCGLAHVVVSTGCGLAQAAVQAKSSCHDLRQSSVQFAVHHSCAACRRLAVGHRLCGSAGLTGPLPRTPCRSLHQAGQRFFHRERLPD